MQGWVSDSGKSKARDLTLSRGLLQSAAGVDFPEGFLTKANNVDSRYAPAIQVRNGFSYDLGSGVVKAYAVFNSLLYAATQQGIYSLGTAREDTGEILFTSLTSVQTHASSTIARYQFANFNNQLIFSRDNSPIDNGLFSYKNGVITQLTNCPITPRLLELHANRFFVAGTNQPDTYSNLYYSNLRDPAGWSDTDLYVGGGVIRVDTSDDTRITALVSFGGQLLIFKDQSMHILYGEDATNFSLSKLFDIGCVSDSTVVKTADALYWLAADGFYRYQAGGIPQRISDPVKDLLGAPDRGWDLYSAAGWDGRFIYVSPATLSTTKTYTAVYDTVTGAWWSYNWANTAYMKIGPTLIAGTTSGRTIKLGGASDLSTAISWEAVSAPLRDGDETVRRTINRVRIIADIDPGSTMTVAYAQGAEGENWQTLRTFTNQSGVPESIDIPMIVQVPGTWYRLRFTGTGPARIHRINIELTRRGN